MSIKDSGQGLSMGSGRGNFIERLRYLIPTAEVSLTNLVREQILAEDELRRRCG